MIFQLIFCFFVVMLPSHVAALDWHFEGRLKSGSAYVFDPPQGFSNFDTDVELRAGVLGNAWHKDEWNLDYEISGNFKHVGGPRVQAGFEDDFDADFFRAWLRLEKGNYKIRGGRQKILFGAGAIFRPLGFFDTRDVSGIIPETRGVDGVRASWFTSDTSSVEGWVVPGKFDDHLIAGLRGEMLIGGVEAGVAAQYHPVTHLTDLPDFDLELYQFGYHLKGEYTAGFWNESRMDIEHKNGQDSIRFQTVLGVDYTFDVGQGLHVLLEYFLSTQERGFTLKDIKGDRTIHQLGLLFDQPVGIDIVWQLFVFFDLLDRSFQIVPQVEYSLTEQIFIYARATIGESIDGDNRTGRLFIKAPVFTGTESSLGLAVVAYF